MKYTLLIPIFKPDDPFEFIDINAYGVEEEFTLKEVIDYVSDESQIYFSLRNRFVPASENGRVLGEFLDPEKYKDHPILIGYTINKENYKLHCALTRIENLTMKLKKEFDDNLTMRMIINCTISLRNPDQDASVSDTLNSITLEPDYEKKIRRMIKKI